MKNISTSINQQSVTLKEITEEKPSRRTINLIRQFARVYSASSITALPGIVLN